MMSLGRTVILILGLASAQMCAQVAGIRVTNPSDAPRMHETVLIPWGGIQKAVSAPSEQLRLVDEQTRSLAFQIDDLDADGTPDEFVFVVSLKPRETKTFRLTDTADSLPLPTGPFRTDAVNYKRINGVATSIDDDNGPGTLRKDSFYPFDGVGWESEVIGYRVYLDERNAMDIQAKRIPGLHWDYIGRTGVDYQLDAYWGMDVLHVGPALGIGGIGVWSKGKIVHPLKLDRRRTRVIARGPVRAVVRVDYDGWDVNGSTIDLTSLLTISGGDRCTEHRILLRSKTPQTIAVGMVKHEAGKATWDEQVGALWTEGPQSRTQDSLFMSLNVDRTTIVRVTEDEWNHLVLLKAEQGKPVTCAISAAWEGEGEGWREGTGRAYVEGIARRLNEPLKVVVTQERR